MMRKFFVYIFLLSCWPTSFVLAHPVDIKQSKGINQQRNEVPQYTYYGDVKPIIDAYCTGCHSPSGQSPFALDTYEAVSSKSAWIADVVKRKVMPPWGANSIEGHKLSFDSSLSEKQTKMILDWAQSQKLAGDPSQPGDAIYVPKMHLPQFDKTYRMLEPWTTAAGEDDEYRCFPVLVDSAEPFYVTGYKLEHDNAALIHHAFVFAFDPEYATQVQAMDDGDPGYGYRCLVSPTTAEYYGLPAHTVAVSGLQGYEWAFTAGQGLLLKPGSILIFQMHYSKHLLKPGQDEAALNTSRTSIHLATQKSVSHPIESAYLMDLHWLEPGVMKIPAGQSDVSYTYSAIASQAPSIVATRGTVNIQNGFYLNGLFPHQHLLARGLKIGIERAQGQHKIIFDNMDRYNFHFQSIFQFEQPIFVGKDDKLSITCRWDNSDENQPYHDGDKQTAVDVYWGEQTTDEMCVATLLISEP